MTYLCDDGESGSSDEEYSAGICDSPSLILHFDVDNFYVSVHRLHDPTLKGVPVCVHQTNAGGIIALSDEAKELGIRKSEGVGAAGNEALNLGGRTIFELRQQFPKVVFVEMKTTLYRHHRDAVVDWLRRNCGKGAVVQNTSYDDNYVDIRNVKLSTLPSQPHQSLQTTPTNSSLSQPLIAAGLYAHSLRKSLHKSLRLPVTIGVARSKLAAKLAGAVAKPSKDGSGVCVVPENRTAALFLNSSARDLLGKAALKQIRASLRDFNTVTLREVLAIPSLPPHLREICERLSCGIDEQEVVASGLQATMSCQQAFNPRSGVDPKLLALLCATLLERVGGDLEERKPVKLTVTVKKGDRSGTKSMAHDWVATGGVDWIINKAMALCCTETMITRVGVQATFAKDVVGMKNITSFFMNKTDRIKREGHKFATATVKNSPEKKMENTAMSSCLSVTTPAPFLKKQKVSKATLDNFFSSTTSAPVLKKQKACGVDDEKVANLLEMGIGFSKIDAVVALKECGGDVNGAALYLVGKR